MSQITKLGLNFYKICFIFFNKGKVKGNFLQKYSLSPENHILGGNSILNEGKYYWVLLAS